MFRALPPGPIHSCIPARRVHQRGRRADSPAGRRIAGCRAHDAGALYRRTVVVRAYSGAGRSSAAATGSCSLQPLRPQPQPLAAKPVPAHDRDSVCGPAKRGASPESLGTIKSGRDQDQEELYTTGAELVIDGGLQDGLGVGRNLVVRRYYRALGEASTAAVGEHSAGLLQIVAAVERSSIAVVVYACDELRKGDFLAPFKPEPIRAPDPVGTPSYSDAARILFADDGQTLGVPRRLMVIARGTNRGTRVGQRFHVVPQEP